MQKRFSISIPLQSRTISLPFSSKECFLKQNAIPLALRYTNKTSLAFVQKMRLQTLICQANLHWFNCTGTSLLQPRSNLTSTHMKPDFHTVANCPYLLPASSLQNSFQLSTRQRPYGNQVLRKHRLGTKNKRNHMTQKASSISSCDN